MSCLVRTYTSAQNVKKYLRNSQIWWIAIDLGAMVCAYFLAIHFRQSETGQRLLEFVIRIFGEQPGAVSTSLLRGYIERAPRILALLAIPIVLSYGLCDLYQPQQRLWPQPVLWSLVKANLAVFLLLMLSLYFQRNLWHPRSFFLLFFLLNVLTARLFRYAFGALQAWFRLRFDLGFWRVLLVGDTEEANRIERQLFYNPQLGLRLTERVKRPIAGPGAILEDDLFARLERQNIDILIVADAGIDRQDIMRLLKRTETCDIGLKVMTHALSVLQSHAGIATDHVHGIPLIHFDPPSLNRKTGLPRRVLSWCLATGALLVTFPILMISALLIKLEDDGPVLFVQTRIGVNQKPFKMYKFRTMHVDAEMRQAEFEALNESGGQGLFKIRRDPRITRIGQLLRKFSIDELPQLLNVLRGDMRLIGPRPLPERDFNAYVEDWHYDRHAGMPGLTGLWQISGRSELDFESMCILDLFYLRNQNWSMDLKIALKTAWVILFARGAY